MTIEIKICGLTNRHDAEAAIEIGADYLGFVFYKKSVRAVSVSQVSKMRADLPAGVRCVGVFVNEPVARVLEIVGECSLYAAQIHGDEQAEEFRRMGLRIWRAVKRSAGQWQPALEQWPAERYVADAAVAGQYGGTGVAGDWAAAACLAARWPVMLAGGLNPDNVSDAVRLVRPAGLDVASGVESAPGRKDLEKMRRFIDNARETAALLKGPPR